jgi:hypothetical protein
MLAGIVSFNLFVAIWSEASEGKRPDQKEEKIDIKDRHWKTLTKSHEQAEFAGSCSG